MGANPASTAMLQRCMCNAVHKTRALEVSPTPSPDLHPFCSLPAGDASNASIAHAGDAGSWARLAAVASFVCARGRLPLPWVAEKTQE